MMAMDELYEEMPTEAEIEASQVEGRARHSAAIQKLRVQFPPLMESLAERARGRKNSLWSDEYYRIIELLKKPDEQILLGNLGMHLQSMQDWIAFVRKNP